MVLDLFEVLCFFGHPFALELVDRCPSSSSDLNPFVLLFFDPLEPSDSRAQRVRAEALHARHDSAHPVSRPAARRAARRAGLARHVASLATRAAPFAGAESRAFATDFSPLFAPPQLCKAPFKLFIPLDCKCQTISVMTSSNCQRPKLLKRVGNSETRILGFLSFACPASRNVDGFSTAVIVFTFSKY